jgi:hypothetical protein
MSRDPSELDIKVLMLDGEHMAERCVVVALAITADGTKKPGRAVGRLHITLAHHLEDVVNGRHFASGLEVKPVRPRRQRVQEAVRGDDYHGTASRQAHVPARAPAAAVAHNVAAVFNPVTDEPCL